MSDQITPKLLAEYARRIRVQPPGAQDPQDWGEMTDLFGRAFDAAAARIAELEREIAVRDRALRNAIRDFSGCGDEQVTEDVGEYLNAARAELAEEAETDD